MTNEISLRTYESLEIRTVALTSSSVVAVSAGGFVSAEEVAAVVVIAAVVSAESRVATADAGLSLAGDDLVACAAEVADGSSEFIRILEVESVVEIL